MLNNSQIKLVQTAARAAGLRGKGFDGRYRLLLGQYTRSNGSAVTSCKQLTNSQLEDFLGVCESLGWRCPGKEADHFRTKAKRSADAVSYAQLAAIEHLAGDLGFTDAQLAGMVRRVTKDRTDKVITMSPREGYCLIEALKNMLSRKTGKEYSNLDSVKKDMEVEQNGKKAQE